MTRLLKTQPITKERIARMLDLRPRRHRLTDLPEYLLPVLKEPGVRGSDWNLVFPFFETFVRAFEAAHTVEHIPFRSYGGRPMCFTYLKKASPGDIEEIQRWLSVVSKRVGIRDCLSICFALDYERECGNPSLKQTQIALLRSRAKTYGKKPQSSNRHAAEKLADECVKFLREVRSYDQVDCVVAAPPSKPDTPFDLSRHLAQRIAKEWGREDLTASVTAARQRDSVKDLPVGKKLDTLCGSIAASEHLKDKTVLLIDDLYQSGVTLNYTAMVILGQGAKAVLGLACEKTCRNDDNVGSRYGN